jgi:hypothetical protein
MVSMMGGKGRASSLYLAQKILDFYIEKRRIVKKRNVDKGETHGPNNPKCHLNWCLIEFIDWR